MDPLGGWTSRVNQFPSWIKPARPWVVQREPWPWTGFRRFRGARGARPGFRIKHHAELVSAPNKFQALSTKFQTRNLLLLNFGYWIRPRRIGNSLWRSETRNWLTQGLNECHSSVTLQILYLLDRSALSLFIDRFGKEGWSVSARTSMHVFSTHRIFPKFSLLKKSKSDILNEVISKSPRATSQTNPEPRDFTGSHMIKILVESTDFEFLNNQLPISKDFSIPC